MGKSDVVNLLFSPLKGCVCGQHIQRHEGLKLLLVGVPTRREDTPRPSVSMVRTRDTFRMTRSKKWTLLSRDLGGKDTGTDAELSPQGEGPGPSFLPPDVSDSRLWIPNNHIWARLRYMDKYSLPTPQLNC